MTHRFIARTVSCCLFFFTLLGVIQPAAYAVFSTVAQDRSTTRFFDTVQISYINNANTGEYLYNDPDELITSSGELSTLGNSIKYRITPLADGSYTIQSVRDPGLYLSASSTTQVYLTELTDTAIPNRYRWNILSASGGCLIQNVNTQRYLYDNGRLVTSSSTLGNEGTSTYKSRVWRIADSTSFYGTNSSYSFIELPTNYSFNTFYLFAGESNKPTLNDAYNNVLYRTADNFTFTGFDSNYVTLNALTGTFTASSAGSLYSTSVTATHKVTGHSTTFTLVLNPRAICVGVTNTGHDHSSALNTISSNLTSCGYSSAPVYTGAFTASQISSYLDSDENNIFISRSHGGINVDSSGTITGTRILLSNHSVDDPNGICFLSNSIYTYDKDYTNLKLVMFIGCKTACGNSNLPSVAVENGAQTAVGFTGSINCGDANAWTEDFFLLLQSGMSVYSACYHLAELNKYSSTEMTSFDIYGYQSTRIN